MDGATMAHWGSLLRTIKFVISTRVKVLKMEPTTKCNDLWSISAFCDSDYAGDKDSRISITGYLIYVLGAPVAWKSKSQKSVTLSSSEAEYVAMSETVTEVLYIKQILEFLGINIDKPIQVNMDNVGAMYMANLSGTSQRTKHVDVQYHFVQEYIEDGEIKVEFVRT